MVFSTVCRSIRPPARIAMSWMSRLVAGLVLGPGTVSEVPVALDSARAPASETRRRSLCGITRFRCLARFLRQVPLPCWRLMGAAGLLLPAEIDRDDVRSVVTIGNGGVRLRVPCRRSRPARAPRAPCRPTVAWNCSPKSTAGSTKAVIARERDLQLGGYLVEGEADRKSVVVDLQVPELVLQHDRHLVGEAFAQVRRDIDTPRRRS